MLSRNFLIFFSSALLFLCGGCSIVPASALDDKLDSLTEPMVLGNYTEVFCYIAQREDLPQDAETLLHLAADSEIHLYPVDEHERYLYVITPHYYGNGDTIISDRVRGVTSNGDYFILRPLNHDSEDTHSRFELVGVAYGNAYSWGSSPKTGRRLFITGEHMSATESKLRTYEWDGRVFRLLGPSEDVASP